MSYHLSFTVGPVQGFVAQARRTRDLWAGSWLLSYLAECALVAAEQADGDAIIPARREPKKITSKQTTVGGIPNRFELTFESRDKADKTAKNARAAFEEAWRRVASAVWHEYVESIAQNGNGTREIWNRQVENFWELSWVIGEPEGGAKTIGRLAAARRQFRNVPATAEPGTKCSLMGNLQEISGCTGSKQDTFWWSVVESAGEHNFRMTRTGRGEKRVAERLCAIALIKRLFPKVIDKAFPTHEGYAVHEELRNQTGWPSTAFFAVLPWLKSLEGETLEKAKQFAQKAAAADIGTSEQQAAKETDVLWTSLDAPAWFRSALQQNEWKIEDNKHDTLVQQLRALYEKAGRQPIPYYALLLMDGDSMGNLIEKLGHPSKLSECLGAFAGKVENIVREHNGRTIYAGGDDTLAMLPATTAFDAADQLAQAYAKSFENTNAREDATLSGAIVYAHWKFPLRQVIATAHHLLDDIAKERTGRDALAIGILQGSGLSALWSAPWKVVRGKKQGAPALKEMLGRFGGDDTDQEAAEFNASYLYHLREQFRRLFPDFREEPGTFARFECDENILRDIAHAEYRRRMRSGDKRPPDETRREVQELMALSRRWRRKRVNATFNVDDDANSFSFDGWRVARFLKQVEDGRMASHE